MYCRKMRMDMTSSFDSLFALLVISTLSSTKDVESRNYDVTCEDIRCRLESSACPKWYHCDSNKRVCEPCSQCSDGSDIPHVPPNCAHPNYCATAARPEQQNMCPALRIAEGHRCWATCSPCGTSCADYLGTTCTVKCESWIPSDSDVFTCIFMNDKAQWNMTSIPPYIEYGNCVTPSPPTVATGIDTSAPHLPRYEEIVQLKEFQEPSTTLGVMIVIPIIASILFITLLIVAGFCIYRRKKSPPSTADQQEEEKRLREEPTEAPRQGIVILDQEPNDHHPRDIRSLSNGEISISSLETEQTDVRNGFLPRRYPVENEDSCAVVQQREPVQNSWYSDPVSREIQYSDPASIHAAFLYTREIPPNRGPVEQSIPPSSHGFPLNRVPDETSIPSTNYGLVLNRVAEENTTAGSTVVLDPSYNYPPTQNYSHSTHQSSFPAKNLYDNQFDSCDHGSIFDLHACDSIPQIHNRPVHNSVEHSDGPASSTPFDPSPPRDASDSGNPQRKEPGTRVNHHRDNFDDHNETSCKFFE